MWSPDGKQIVISSNRSLNFRFYLKNADGSGSDEEIADAGNDAFNSLDWSRDGKYILAGNYMTQDFSILKVDGTKVTDTGKRFKVPGHPASARMSH